MTWVRLDDSVTSHAKIAAAGPDAFVLWVGGLAYANRHATDGHIPDSAIGMLFPATGWTVHRARQLAARLVAASLWEPTEGGGWSIHGYAEYQEEALRANVEKRREAERERKRRWREHGAVSKTAVNQPRPAGTDDQVSQPVPAVSRLPGPPRPSPALPVQPEEREARAPEHPSRDVTSVAPTDPVREAEPIRAYLAAEWKAKTGAVPPDLSALSPKTEVVAKLLGLPARPELDGILTRFFDDKAMKGKGWPVGWLLKNPVQWSSRSTGGGGYAQPREAHEYQAEEMSFADLMKRARQENHGGR